MGKDCQILFSHSQSSSSHLSTTAHDIPNKRHKETKSKMFADRVGEGRKN